MSISRAKGLNNSGNVRIS